MQRRVLLVHNYYQIPGGEDTVVSNEKKLLEDNGYKVYTYSRNNSEIKCFSILKKAFLPFIAIFNFQTYWSIYRLILKEKIDIVHVHNTLALVSPAVYYASVHCSVPVIQTIHNFRLLCPAATFYRDNHICEDCIQNSLLSAIKHNCYHDSKMQTSICVVSLWLHRFLRIYKKLNYICLTDFNRMKLLKVKQISDTQVFVKPNFVDGTKSRLIPYNQRERRFIYAGRIDQLKGIRVLLKTWEVMGKDGPDLIICGTGPMENWCNEFIKSKNLDNVKMLGNISNYQTRMLMSDSLALILPTQWYEGFPMTIVEAFSVGTPVIGSNIGNVGSIIKEGITGWKIRHDSVIDLRNAIMAVEDISDTVRAEYEKMYSAEHNFEMLVDIYENILKKDM